MHFTLILFFVVSLCYGNHVNAMDIYIKGSFNKSDLNGKMVRFEYYSAYSQTGAWRPSKASEIKITKNRINIKLGGVQKVGYLKIILPDSKFNRFSYVPLLVESGDRIEFNQMGDGIKFKGKNAGKFSCQLDISSVRPIQVVSQVSDSTYFATSYEAYRGAADVKLNKLETYRSNLSNEFFAILKANILYNVDS